MRSRSDVVRLVQKLYNVPLHTALIESASSIMVVPFDSDVEPAVLG